VDVVLKFRMRGGGGDTIRYSIQIEPVL